MREDGWRCHYDRGSSEPSPSGGPRGLRAAPAADRQRGSFYKVTVDHWTHQKFFKPTKSFDVCTSDFFHVVNDWPLLSVGASLSRGSQRTATCNSAAGPIPWAPTATATRGRRPPKLSLTSSALDSDVLQGLGTTELEGACFCRDGSSGEIRKSWRRLRAGIRRGPAWPRNARLCFGHEEGCGLTHSPWVFHMPQSRCVPKVNATSVFTSKVVCPRQVRLESLGA